MTLEELRRCLNELGGKGNCDGDFLFSVAQRLDAGVIRDVAEYAAFEIGLSSDLPNARIQLTHLHIHPPIMPAQRQQETLRLKAASARNAAFTAVAGTAGWRLEPIEQTLSDLLDLEMIGGSSLFSCEYDRRRGCVSKITLYAKPKSFDDMQKLLARLDWQIDNAWIERDLKNELDCIGIDFLKTGIHGLKLYRKLPIDSLRRLKPAMARSVEVVSSQYPAKDILLLERTQRSGSGRRSHKVCLRLQRALSFEDAAASQGLLPFRSFFRSLRPLLMRKKIYYLCWKGPKALEIIFRETLAPWDRLSKRDRS